ncbi:GNAT family N-acetyltransferase [Halocola ammonii]
MIAKTFPKLETSRLTLRQISESDRELIFKGLSHPEVIRYYGVSFDSLEATKEQMEWFRDLEKKATGIWWAICSKDQSQFYGAAGFNNLDRKTATAEIGFWLLPEFWGKGITTEAVELVLDYASCTLDLKRVEAYVEIENENSKNVLQKQGFVLEKTMSNCEEKNGKLISLDVFAKHFK